MAFRMGDRVLETTTSTGVGTITLAGAVAGYRAFSTVVSADGDWFIYTITGGTQWEVGKGVRLSATTFSRASADVLASSTGSIISFSAGTKEVWVDASASTLQGSRLNPTRNIIINGGFEISQQNIANAITGTGFGPDCWVTTTSMASATITTQQLTSTLGAGSRKMVVLTSTTGAAVAAGERASHYTAIEGYRWARLGYAVDAQPAVLSFWIRATLSGTFVVAVQNGAATRSYVKTVPISAGSTWEYKQILIPGDTTGSWDVGTGVGARILFNFAGGATFQGTDATWQAGDKTGVAGQTNFFANNSNVVAMTAVSLVRGIEGPLSSEAIAMHRSYDEEFPLTERYYETSFSDETAPAQNIGLDTGEYVEASSVAGTAGAFLGSYPFRTRKRVTPTMTGYNPAAANAQVRDRTLGADTTATAFVAGRGGFYVTCTTHASTATGNRLCIHWIADARLS
jgi:hypothetical protein